MTPPNNDAKRNKLHALQASYQAQLPQRLEELQAGWRQLRMGNEDAQLAELLHRQAHTLAGSAGTFGFSQVSGHARQLERLLQNLSPAAVDEGMMEQIETLLGLLEQSAALGPDTERPTGASEAEAPAAIAESTATVAYVLDQDASLVNQAVEQLTQYGYSAEGFTRVADAEQAVKKQLPNAMVIDMALQPGEPGDSAGGLVTSAMLEHGVPMIFTADHNDWETRLRAARLGAKVFVPKPLDMTLLVDRVNELSGVTEEDPYRVLIIEDMELLASHYAAVLEAAGMVVETLNQPAGVLPRLEDLRPDLILTDLYMPECSGVDVASVIRQDSHYDNVPIVYLSTENVVSEQLVALSAGGDDFLQKPIRDTHLVLAVTTRAKRFRRLRLRMSQDSLTGLKSHGVFKQELVSTLSLAVRNQHPLTVAMIDIDHFKAVNDNYGHPAGDQVIKRLAILLSQRLRSSDLIARYGGEEFAVAFPDTSMADAEVLLDELRASFAEILHAAGDHEFRATFSAGLAGGPPHTQPEEIIAAADTALYEAKRNGRNRVMRASDVSRE